MKSKYALTAADVNTLLDRAEQEANANGWAVTICVVDDGGHALGLRRLDGASPATSALAEGKARSAAIFRAHSGVFEDRIASGRTAMVALQNLVPLRGGVPMVWDGEVVGAVGVAGVLPDQDEQIAVTAVTSLDN